MLWIKHVRSVVNMASGWVSMWAHGEMNIYWILKKKTVIRNNTYLMASMYTEMRRMKHLVTVCTNVLGIYIWTTQHTRSKRGDVQMSGPHTSSIAPPPQPHQAMSDHTCKKVIFFFHTSPFIYTIKQNSPAIEAQSKLPSYWTDSIN